jgi:hypothetical protein
MPQAAGQNRIPAFYAELSATEIAHLGDHQTVIFDTAKLNHGNVYNTDDGVFTAPTSGTYAFTWRIMIEAGRHQYTELVVNGTPYALAYVYAHELNNYDTDTTFTLVDMIAGITALIRTRNASSDGRVIHGYSFSTFSGWLIQACE